MIKHNTNDYMVSEQIEYISFLAAMSTANILIQKWNEQYNLSYKRIILVFYPCIKFIKKNIFDMSQMKDTFN